MSDLFGNHIVGFPMRWINFKMFYVSDLFRWYQIDQLGLADGADGCASASP